nr:hypothetical protein CFP56_29926 [Quercus suber]
MAVATPGKLSTHRKSGVRLISHGHCGLRSGSLYPLDSRIPSGGAPTANRMDQSKNIIRVEETSRHFVQTHEKASFSGQ